MLLFIQFKVTVISILNGINILAASTPQICKFFKKTYVNPRRWGVMIREKQVQEMLEKGLII
jgi:hypothetical protein